MATASSRLAGDRPVPNIVTELPGPKARAHVAFDETWTSPSLPRAYPIVPVRGDGLTVEDIDGNLFLDFAAGIAVNSTGHSHPQVVAAIKEQAAELIHFSASDFYLPIYPEVCRQLARQRAVLRARPGLPRQLRGRGRRGVHQARPLRHQASVRGRLPRRLPRPDLRRRLADGLEGQVPRRLRAAAAGRLPRAVRPGRGPALVRRGAVREARPGQRGRGDHRRAHPGRGRLPGARRTGSSRVCAASATSTASCSSPTRSSPAPGGPGRCGPSSTGASSRTCCSRPRASPRACRSARWSPGPSSSRPGGRAHTGRPTAATRSPVPRPWPRSNCWRTASSRTPGSAATRRWPACDPWPIVTPTS